ncbi:MAG: hypothetical protein RSA96_01635 [Erysipelotrichaceae bacterium]
MEMKSKNLKVRNLPQDKEPVDKINSKPYAFIVVFLLMGTYMIITKYYFLGILIVAVFLYNLFFIKNRVNTEFYDDYVVFYNENDKEECFILFYDEIREWKYIRGRFDVDTLEVTFRDGKRIKFKSLSKGKMLKHFRDHAYRLEVKKEISKKTASH